MKYIIPTLIIGLFLASCAETEVPEITPKVSHQVTFEVYCDTCLAYYAVNAFGNTVADSVFGYYTHDTVAYDGDGVNISGISWDKESDSIHCRILSDGVLLADSIQYLSTPDDESIVLSLTYIFQ